jgi:hypothetical protein
VFDFSRHPLTTFSAPALSFFHMTSAFQIGLDLAKELQQLQDKTKEILADWQLLSEKIWHFLTEVHSTTPISEVSDTSDTKITHWFQADELHHLQQSIVELSPSARSRLVLDLRRLIQVKLEGTLCDPKMLAGFLSLGLAKDLELSFLEAPLEMNDILIREGYGSILVRQMELELHNMTTEQFRHMLDTAPHCLVLLLKSSRLMITLTAKQYLEIQVSHFMKAFKNTTEDEILLGQAKIFSNLHLDTISQIFHDYMSCSPDLQEDYERRIYQHLIKLSTVEHSLMVKACTKEFQGNTPLIAAILAGNADGVAFLLRILNVDPLEPNQRGVTPYKALVKYAGPSRDFNFQPANTIYNLLLESMHTRNALPIRFITTIMPTELALVNLEKWKAGCAAPSSEETTSSPPSPWNSGIALIFNMLRRNSNKVEAELALGIRSQLYRRFYQIIQELILEGEVKRFMTFWNHPILRKAILQMHFEIPSSKADDVKQMETTEEKNNCNNITQKEPSLAPLSLKVSIKRLSAQENSNWRSISTSETKEDSLKNEDEESSMQKDNKVSLQEYLNCLQAALSEPTFFSKVMHKKKQPQQLRANAALEVKNVILDDNYLHHHLTMPQLQQFQKLVLAA